jgi:tRNA modification GTPase
MMIDSYADLNDTIAAISTPLGKSGIGIIRISGKEAFDVADKIYKGKYKFSELLPNTINYGWIINPGSLEKLDEVLVSKFKAPKTYTGENTVEINCHGGIAVIKRILEMLMCIGIRAAEPGEFTKRAFLNGRIDLLRAEAVIDVINSKTDKAASAALSQLEGKMSGKLQNIRRQMIGIIANIEAVLDYPEFDIDDPEKEDILEQLNKIKDTFKDILSSFERGRIIRDGITAVICGKPNVGKSSLLNELTGKDRAIVTEIPGTTRDIIEEYVNIKGIPVRLIDTAGIRNTIDTVESMGVKSAKTSIKEADMALVMLDAYTGLQKEDYDVLNETENIKRIVLINKTDVSSSENIIKIEKQLNNLNIIRISVKMIEGLDEIEDEISRMFFSEEIEHNEEILLTNIRHKKLLDKAVKRLDEAVYAIKNGIPPDIFVSDIKEAAENISIITGDSVSADIINEIFSRFCIGK